MNRAAHAQEIRRVYPRVLGKLMGVTRSLVDAEDALHDAVLRALSSWNDTNAPESAEAWLLTVATNAHRDRMRRARTSERLGDAAGALAELCPWARIAVSEPDVLRGWKDDLLRLVFASCHPALEEGESAALALSTVVGLSTDEIARAFMVAPRTMEQRLTRARQRLRDKGDIEGTTPERGHARIGAVLCTIHLLFNEGYWSSAADAPIRADLCRLAIGLARSLVETYPDLSEPTGLLALLMLHDARRDARLNDGGEPVPLPEQNRERWDRAAIREAFGLLDCALEMGAPGPFTTQAAIAAVHCRALSADDTDWREIAALYALLEGFRPTPAVRVNRAFALAKASGAAEGLALLERADIEANACPYANLVRGTLLGELGRTTDAIATLEQALRSARNDPERRQIRDKIQQLARKTEDPGS